MTPDANQLELILKIAGIVFAAGGAWWMLTDVSRKASRAHERLDEMSKAQNVAEQSRARWEGRLEEKVDNLIAELARLRESNDAARVQMIGPLSRIEMDLDELKERPRGG